MRPQPCTADSRKAVTEASHALNMHTGKRVDDGR